MKRAVLGFLILFPCFAAFGQDNKQQQIDSLKKLLSVAGRDSSAVKLLNQIANTYNFIDAQEGVKWAMKGKALAEEINWINGVGRSYLILAGNYNFQSSYYQALMSNFGALRIFILDKDKARTRKSMANICRIYQLLSDYPKALEYGYLALGKNPRDVEPDLRATIYGYISTIHTEKKEYPLALQYSDSALAIYKMRADKKAMAGIYSNRAIIYYNQAQYEQAIDFYTQSMKISEELNDLPSIQIVMANLGLVFLNLGETEKALEYQNRALELSILTKNRMAIAINNGNIAETYLTLANDNESQKSSLIKQSIDHYEEAIRTCKALGIAGPLSLFTQNLSKAYESAGQHEKALLTYQEHIAIRDSLYSAERELQFAKLKNERDIDLKALDIMLQSKGVEIDYLKEKNERLILIGCVVILIMVSIFLYYRLFSKVKSHQRILTDISQIQSHRVRSPVARILGLADLLQRNESPELEKKELLKYIYDSAQELDLIIREVVGKTIEPGKKSFYFKKDLKDRNT